MWRALLLTNVISLGWCCTHCLPKQVLVSLDTLLFLITVFSMGVEQIDLLLLFSWVCVYVCCRSAVCHVVSPASFFVFQFWAFDMNYIDLCFFHCWFPGYNGYVFCIYWECLWLFSADLCVFCETGEAYKLFLSKKTSRWHVWFFFFVLLMQSNVTKCIS